MDTMSDQDDNELFEDGENLDISNEPAEGAQEKNDNSNDEEEKKTVKPKRIIRNPMPKLDAELLKGPKGLGNLEKCFERVQFKGKGYEEQDLTVLLKTYEYWCHRLYPRFPFKNCIEKIAKLGSKGPIQTYLKKVRSGLVDDDDDTKDALPNFNSDDDEPGQTNDVFQSSTQPLMADIQVELTEDQLETIRRNRERAQQLRLERLRKIQEKAAINLMDTNGSTKTPNDEITVESSLEISTGEMLSEKSCVDTSMRNSEATTDCDLQNINIDNNIEFSLAEGLSIGEKKILNDKDNGDSENFSRINEEMDVDE